MRPESHSVTHSAPDHLRIAFVITRSDTIGGAAVHVRDLATALAKVGHRVRVFVGGGGMYVGHLADRGVDVVSIPSLVRELAPRQDAQAIRQLRQRLQEFGPDLVSTHSSKAGWLGRLVAYGLDIPVLFTAHGWAFTAGVAQPLRSVYCVAEMVAARFATLIVTVSDFDRELALRWKVTPASHITTVHNGVPDIDRCLLAQPDTTPPVIAMIARLDTPKDHPLLFRALATLTYRPFQIMLIGDGPFEDRLRKMAYALGIGDRVQFLGFQDDVRTHLATAQIFALVSEWEGFPRSVLEAMRAGLPVVASQVGGVGESVVDGQTGYLCPRGDMETLRNRLSRLLENPALRQRMGQAGRIRYLERFTMERLMGETMAVYRCITEQDVSRCKGGTIPTVLVKRFRGQ